LDPSEPILAVEDLFVSYGKIEALKGVSLSVNRGEIVVLVGANGAGKTTLMETILGANRASSGRVSYAGKAITNRPVEANVRSGMSLVPEGRGVFTTMSVLDNLLLGARFDRKNRSARLSQVYAHFPVLADRKHQIAGTLSGGERQMVAIARALMSSPQLILIDEPSIGLAPLIVNSLFRILEGLNQEGYSLLLSEQNVNKALKIAHRGYVLETGRVVTSGPSADLLNDPTIHEAYLGAK
jgi:branched-chain amino acid transport system ATP-binding protein